jgi:hypothetical protein
VVVGTGGLSYACCTTALVAQIVLFVFDSFNVADPFAAGRPTVRLSVGAAPVLHCTWVEEVTVAGLSFPFSLPFPAQLQTSACAAAASAKMARQAPKSTARMAGPGSFDLRCLGDKLFILCFS